MAEKRKLANIPKVLLLYRLHTDNVSNIHAKEQAGGARVIRQAELEKLGLQPTLDELFVHNSSRPKNNTDIKTFLTMQEKWLQKIIDANKKSHIYKEKSLRKVIYKRWYDICSINLSHGTIVWEKFKNSSLYKLGGSKRMFDSIKIFIKTFWKK